MNFSISEFVKLVGNDIYHIFHREGLEQRQSFTNNREYLSVDLGAAKLKSLILSGQPLCAGRIGSTECQTVYKYLQRKHGLYSKGNNLSTLCNFSGFFPEDISLLDSFCQMMIQNSSNVDFLALLRSSYGEYHLINNYYTNAYLSNVQAMDPIRGWTSALRGKKVLVIHPFAESIESQYKKREQIYPNTDILPDFDLYTLKAVQTVAGQRDERFANWFDALDYMANEISKIDFDIALIGCSAYGLPLATKIKAMGKQAIHVGGALLLLFGIRGQRWDTRDFMQPFYNEYWVRPSEKERPENAKKVEGACYW